MRALQVSVLVATALLALQENGVVAAPRGTYAVRTVHQASSSPRSNVGPAPLRGQASNGRQSVVDGRAKQQQRGIYSPVDYTPEVKTARAAFFKLYDKQAKLTEEARDRNVAGHRYDRQRTVAGPVDDGDDDLHYYYYYDEDHSNEDDHDFEDEYEEESHEEDSDDEEEESNEESDDEEDSHDYEGDSDEESDSSSSSSSSEEDGGVSSSEEGNGEDSSMESSEESADGEDSSSSSSSEEDGDGRFDVASWGRRNTNALLARTPKPVTDTPEVKQEKRNFFRLYKKQAELSFNAPDH